MCSYLEEVKTYDFVVVCVQVIEGLCGECRVITNSRRQESHSTRANNKYTHCSFEELKGTILTVHGLQSDQTRDKVVKVNSHVLLRVAQDDQLEQVVVQLEPWKREQRTQHS